MCLMQTDLPVPDGPRIIEILPSGRPMFRPRRILLRPNDLWTSTNSTASGTPVGRLRPVCQRYSSSAAGRAAPARPTRGRHRPPASGSPAAARPRPAPVGVPAADRARRGRCVGAGRDRAPRPGSRRRSPAPAPARPSSSSDRGARVGAPEELGAEHPDEMHEHDVQHHRLRGRRARRRRARRWRCSRSSSRRARSPWPWPSPLIRLNKRSGGFWNIQKISEVAALRDLADLLHHRQVAGEEARADRGDVDERQHHPRGQQARRAEEGASS